MIKLFGVLRRSALGAVLIAAGLAGATSAEEVEFRPDVGGLPPGLPFSAAVRVGDTYYLSGQVGTVPGTDTLVPGGVEAEARQTLENIRRVLEELGLGLENVVKCTVMLADIGEWEQFNTIYREIFQAPYPARSAFGADGLALGARVEVECLAAIRDS
jgi:2-iminobutanoate/2-iminopropanoate deaminase